MSSCWSCRCPLLVKSKLKHDCRKIILWQKRICVSYKAYLVHQQLVPAHYYRHSVEHNHCNFAMDDLFYSGFIQVYLCECKLSITSSLLPTQRVHWGCIGSSIKRILALLHFLSVNQFVSECECHHTRSCESVAEYTFTPLTSLNSHIEVNLAIPNLDGRTMEHCRTTFKLQTLLSVFKSQLKTHYF